MVIHVVSQGETLDSIGTAYEVSPEILQRINELPNPEKLVVGQTIVVRKPIELYKVVEGDTLYGIAQKYETTPLAILQNNPQVAAMDTLPVGTELIIRFEDQEPEFEVRRGNMYVNGYAYPFIDRTVLKKTLPYLTYLTIFTYGFQPNGDLVAIDDVEVIKIARQFGVGPVMLISTLTDEGVFNNELSHTIISNQATQDVLIQNILDNMNEKGYVGLDIDFEYILPEDRQGYVDFVQRVATSLNANGYFVMVALAPKTSINQPGLLYTAHDYRALGEVANSVLLMTYEWGYTFGPPMAVSPLNKVRDVVEFGVSQIPSEKVNMGVPNYGYDWPLPFIKGTTRAEAVGNVQAVERAAQYNVEIEYDEVSQAPFFYYTTDGGVEHVVWFDDARSIEAKLSLVPEYDLKGIGIWNIMKYFPQNWLVLSSRYNIVREQL